MRLAALAIIAVGVAGFAAYDQYDKRVNFKRVDARISAVNEQCYMEKVTREGITKTTSTSDLLRCDLAETLTREHPKWKGYAVKHKIEIRVAYVSPVDGASHTSSLHVCLPQWSAAARRGGSSDPGFQEQGGQDAYDLI